MSIVRVGLAENEEFANGYDAIFGKKDKAKPKPEEQKPEEKAEAKEGEKQS